MGTTSPLWLLLPSSPLAVTLNSTSPAAQDLSPLDTSTPQLPLSRTSQSVHFNSLPSTLGPSFLPFTPAFQPLFNQLSSHFYSSQRFSSTYTITPITSYYPQLARCSTLLDFISVCTDIETIPTIAEAISFAASCHQISDRLNLELIQQHVAYAHRYGLLSLIQSSQDLLHTTCLQANQLERPLPIVPVLPILSITDYTLYNAATPFPRSIALPSLPPLPFPRALQIYDLSPTAKRNLLATQGGPILLHPSFQPNDGINYTIYPEDIAPQSVISVHCARFQHKGQAIIIPLPICRSLCSTASISLHVSSAFLGPKPNTPLCRFISDYKNSHINGFNHPDKKLSLSRAWGPCIGPTAADICTLVLNASLIFPNQLLYGFRIDVSDAFPRIKTAIADVALTTIVFRVFDTDYAMLPLTNRFGSQDSNYQWNVVPLEIIERSHLRSHTAYGCQLTSVYTDDFLGIGNLSYVTSEIASITSDCCSVIASNAISQNKNLVGQIINLLGFRLDLIHNRIGITEKHFIRMFYILFVQFPLNLGHRDPINIRLIQRLGSYMIRLANCIPPLLSFSRSLHNNLSHVSSVAQLLATTNIPLSRRSITDIWVWRIFLILCLHDTRHLSVPISILPLLRLLPTELDPSDLHHSTRCARQAAAADYVIYGDACTTHNGIGFYIPNIGWGSSGIPSLTHYFNCKLALKPVDINVLEFIASLYSLISLLTYLCASTISTTDLHIHIFTDNTACKSWITKHASTHHLHSFLLQVLSFLQFHYGNIITVGHIPGLQNIFADAASRNFNVMNALRIKTFLSQFHQFPTCPPLFDNIYNVAMTPSWPIFALTQKALTTVEQIVSFVSAPLITFPSIPSPVPY